MKWRSSSSDPRGVAADPAVAAGPSWAGDSAVGADDDRPSARRLTAQFEALNATLEQRFDALDAEAADARRRDAAALAHLETVVAELRALKADTAAVAERAARLERRTFAWRYAPYWALGAAGVVLLLAILL